MAIKQTRIFVPPTLPFDDRFWVETMVGLLLSPVVGLTEWFWFSRYIQLKGGDEEDCDIKKIPESFGINNEFSSIGSTGLYRSLRFRYKISDEKLINFETTLKNLIERNDCVISDFRPYKIIDDLGGERFIDPKSSQSLRFERSELIVHYLHDVCKLFLHALEGPDTFRKFHLESYTNCNEIWGALFNTGRHLFCNITGEQEYIIISAN